MRISRLTLKSFVIFFALAMQQPWNTIAIAQSQSPPSGPFRAGAIALDITPTTSTSIIAGGFLEGNSAQIHDRLYVRAIVLDDSESRIALVVVDTCMMTQSLIDEAKQLASQRCKIATNQMMVSATHTHSAPAAMACLGTRADKEYAASLPSKIAEAIVSANERLERARIGWATIDDWEHTHNRRWIRRPETKIVDPFGSASALAHMHPGYLSADIIGPSGPVDPALSVISIQAIDGRPLAVLANYSQHYFGATAVSSDYYGLFSKYVASLLSQPGEGNGPFVCAMSQGTSGDLMWMDYGSSAKSITLDRYAESVARYAERAIASIVYHDDVRLGIVETTLSLNYRVPNASRLEWAKPIASKIENELPKSVTEVYAMEAMILDSRQSTELKLQAIRIGDLTISALPNEVYAITGLKLRAQSPSKNHFNIELANGAEGYIPPPEQHFLGGYTTWPARTAGLEEQAEPKIVEKLVSALEQATNQPRRKIQDVHGPYAKAIVDAKPYGYWRLNEMQGNEAKNAIENRSAARVSNGYAWYLPGVASGSGIGNREQLTPSAFSGATQINRALHLAGGSLQIERQTIANQYSLAMWFWLGEQSGASDRSGTLFRDGDALRIGFRQTKDHLVTIANSRIKLPADQWHMLVVVREQNSVRLFLDGEPVLFLDGDISPIDEAKQTLSRETLGDFVIGEGLQGKIDEIAIFDRIIQADEIEGLWSVSEMEEQSIISKGATLPNEPDSQPISASESLKHIHVPPGYRVELVVSEPNVLDPVAFDWDLAGRLWVVEMADYPLGMDGQGKAGGRVRLLMDDDGDGFFERSQLFVENLNFPTGILTWRDGVLITAAPEILFLRDTDGDGKCDSREVLLQGLNEGNQQLRVNGLRWGIDNWVYCANGGHHANHGLGTKVLSARSGLSTTIGSRDFRFQPDTGVLELESGPSQFGRNRDAWGHWFGTQNANPLWQYVISDRYFARNPFVPATESIRHIVGPGSPVVFPASRLEKRYHSFEQSGRYTSACGSNIYGDNLLFGSSEKMHAFTCEPFHNLVQHNVLEDAGVSFSAKRSPNEEKFDFFASEDRWCRPVMVRTGPDGGLWIADMYRYMIEHPDWLPPAGKSELLPHYRLGDDRGRIYRVVPESNNKSRQPIRLDRLTTLELVDALDCENDTQRDKCQQLLLWKQDSACIEPLKILSQRGQSAQARVQALYTLDGLKALDGTLIVEALGDPHPRVRENAIVLAERRHEAAILPYLIKCASDSDAKVALQLALSLGQWQDESAGKALLKIGMEHADDTAIIAAMMSSALPHATTLIRTAYISHRNAFDKFREPFLRLAIGSNNQQAIAILLLSAENVGVSDDYSVRYLNLKNFLISLERTGSSLAILKAMDATEQFKSSLTEIDKIIGSAHDHAQDSRRPDSERILAATLLCHVPERREFGCEILSKWLRPQYDADLQSSVLDSLRQSASSHVPAMLALAWSHFTPKLRGEAIDVLLSRTVWTEGLVAQMESGTIGIGGIELTQRSRMLQHTSTAIAARSKILFESQTSSSRLEIVESYRPALALKGVAPNGKAVFLRACANCHRRGDEGVDIGPNLATVINHSAEKLLINILDPNVDIQPGYQMVNCLLQSDEILTGIIANETANSITIKRENGTSQVVSRLEVEELRMSKISMMPEGLEVKFSQQELADLIALLQQRIDPK